MNKTVLLASAVAVAFACGTAGAATLTNNDKNPTSAKIEISGGKTQMIKLKSGETFDSKGKDVKITLHGQKEFDAKADAKLDIKGGKVEEQKSAKAETKPEPKKEATKPAETGKPVQTAAPAGTPKPEDAKPAAGGSDKPAEPTQEKK